MPAETFRFKVFSLRKIENPFSSSKGYKSYECIVDVKQLPDLENWRDINVRDPKLTGSVPRKITESFHGNPELFVFMNRGVLVAAEKVEFDQKTSEVILTLGDKTIHGIGDGGHTYTIIRDAAKTLLDDHTQWVKLELLEGFSIDEIALIVEGRNTSNQVKDQSLMELTGQFEKLKELLPKKVVEEISFSEYDLDDSGNPKPIDVRDVIALLTTFNKDHYDDINQPVAAFNSKKTCLDRFKQDIKQKNSSYKKIYPVAKDILLLHDYLYLEFYNLYNEAQKRAGKSRGAFGNLTGVVKHEDGKGPELYFTGKRSKYTVPSGFIYPMLAAFRAFLEEENGVFTWGKKINPLQMVKSDLTIRLAGIIGEEALKNQNPTKTGKSSLLWQSCYQNAELYYLKMK